MSAKSDTFGWLRGLTRTKVANFLQAGLLLNTRQNVSNYVNRVVSCESLLVELNIVEKT